MGRVLTNNVGMSYSIESALGVSGTTWQQLEPNEISTFGAEITTVARDPISKTRQRRKGTVTDLDSAVEFAHDLTLSAFIDFVEGFAFAVATNTDLVFKAANATGTGYTVPALNATQGGKLQYTAGGPISLLYARGYLTSGNNGLKALGADAASTDTEITVSGLAAETAPVEAEVEVAGIRAETGDLALTVTGTAGSLTSGNNAAINNIDFTTLGLTVGQYVHIGGTSSANRLGAANYGYGRITAIAAGELTLDRLGSALATATGAGVQVDLLFGRFVRNVAVDHADFLERSYSFEMASPNLMTAGATGYEYARGNFCDAMKAELPLSDKAGVTFGFIGTDTDVPTVTRKTGADTAATPNRTGAFNTSSDIARLRIVDVDEAGLTTDFKSVSLTLNNNVSPEKVLGQLGAKYMNAGNFEVDLESQVLFTNGDVISRIRDNTTVSMDFSIRNDDGSIMVDIPSMTLGGGDRELPRNETVLLNTTGMAFGDAVLGYSLGVSLFPVVPA